MGESSVSDASRPMTARKLRLWLHAFLRVARYRILRPAAPRHDKPFPNPVVVVGSAPVSHKPEGLDESYTIVTVNGSQTVTKSWGIAKPHITFMMFGQIDAQTVNAKAVRSVLRGERTGLLIVSRWKKGMDRLKSGLAAFDYGADALRVISRLQRMALYEAVLGRLNPELTRGDYGSTGTFAILYLVNSGARTIIITGINPHSRGHVYNNENLQNQHAKSDKDILLALKQRGVGIYTADPEVARLTGLPLWVGCTEGNDLEPR